MAYREQLFAEYNATHGRYLDASDEDKIRWFRAHLVQNYLPHLPPAGANPSILEVGCNKGYLLEVLREHGYERLVGVDLSEVDLSVARSLFDLDVHCVDAVAYMRSHAETYDVIIAKAILEHVEKQAVFPFLEAMKMALKPGGRVLIEVPNMDWLFAQHERYLDFTHEVGFTRESFGQVLRAVFGNAAVHPMMSVLPPSRRIRMKHRLLRPILRRVATSVFELFGEGGHSTWWDVRSIMGIAQKEG